MRVKPIQLLALGNDAFQLFELDVTFGTKNW